MSKIVEVPFRSEAIQAIRQGEQAWVVVRRVCENLGIDPEGQRQRLTDPQRSPWARTCVMQAHDASGRLQEVFALDLDGLPMWLATISPKRVRPEARDKLIAYQRECAKVLRDHFFGVPVPGPDVSALLRDILAQLVPAVMQAVDQRIDERLRGHSLGIVHPWEAGAIKRRLMVAAEAATAIKRFKSRKSAHASLLMRVRTACGWSGTGARLDRMPVAALPHAERELAEIERELERAGAFRALQRAQGSLFPQDVN